MVTVITASESSNTKQDNLEIIKIRDQNENGIPFLADQGYSWMKSITPILFKRNKDDFSTIIISGGPFLQMLWSKELKKKFRAKLILDFRDPFAINPRFNDSFLKKKMKSFLESRMCAYADEVLTVNSFTANLLKCPKRKISIIENGFNEEVIKSITPDETIKGRVVHAGKVGLDRNPIPLIKAVLSNKNMSFEHFGNTIELAPFSERIMLNDFVPYNDVLKSISRAEIGLVLTGGDPFVSTTKIFDYIGLNKKVIIITNGKLNSGSLGEISKRNPNIYWSSNNEKNISEVLQKATESPFVNIRTHEFSRGHEFEKLIALIST